MEFTLRSTCIYITWEIPVPIVWSDIENLRTKGFFEEKIVGLEDGFGLVGAAIEYEYDWDDFPFLQSDVVICIQTRKHREKIYGHRSVERTELKLEDVSDFARMFGEILKPCKKTIYLSIDFDLGNVFDGWEIDTLEFEPSDRIHVHKFLDSLGSSLRKLLIPYKYLFNCEEDNLCDRFPVLASGLEELECHWFPWKNSHVLTNLRRLKCMAVSPEKLPKSVIELECDLSLKAIQECYEMGVKIMRTDYIRECWAPFVKDISQLQTLKCPGLKIFIDGTLVYGKQERLLEEIS